MDVAALSRWISEHAMASNDWDALLDGLCRALVGMGLPLWRVSIGARTLDPNMRAFNLEWHAGGAPALAPDSHGTDREAAYRRSPIFELAERGERFGRWRLDALQEDDDYPLLHELRARGGTDYLLHVFVPDLALTGSMISLTTQSPSGFTDDHVAVVEALRPTLGLAMAKLNVTRTLREVLGIYVGQTTRDYILEGQIRRGQGRTVSAAILLADLRGFTALTDRADPLAVVGWLDEHFEVLGQAVAGHGGEILKFLGDGLLAIFPLSNGEAAAASVCAEALGSAVDALHANKILNNQRRSRGLPEMEADLVLHFGEVVYGNIGSDRRLDFTVIGRAVNEASRIEGHCEALGHTLLISDAFAARCDHALEEVGTVSLRGLAHPQRVWSVDNLITQMRIVQA